MNVEYDKAPSITVTNADAVYLITKTDVDYDGMWTMSEFKSKNAYYKRSVRRAFGKYY